MHRLKDNIRTDLNETGWKNTECKKFLTVWGLAGFQDDSSPWS